MLVGLGALAAGVLIGRYYVPDDRQLRRTARHSRAYMRALSHLLARDHDTAVSELRGVVEENIDDVEPYFALGAMFRSRGEHERAIRVHQALAIRERERKKLRVRAMYELGMDFRGAGMPRRATRAMEEVVLEEPGHEGALRSLAALYEEQARFAEAAELWERIGTRREERGHLDGARASSVRRRPRRRRSVARRARRRAKEALLKTGADARRRDERALLRGRGGAGGRARESSRRARAHPAGAGRRCGDRRVAAVLIAAAGGAAWRADPASAAAHGEPDVQSTLATRERRVGRRRMRRARPQSRRPPTLKRLQPRRRRRLPSWPRRRAAMPSSPLTVLLVPADIEPSTSPTARSRCSIRSRSRPGRASSSALIRAQLAGPADQLRRAELSARARRALSPTRSRVARRRGVPRLAARSAMPAARARRSRLDALAGEQRGLLALGAARPLAVHAVRRQYRPAAFSWRCGQCRRWGTLVIEIRCRAAAAARARAPRCRACRNAPQKPDALLGARARTPALPAATLEDGPATKRSRSRHPSGSSLLGRVGGWMSGVWRRGA